MSGESIQERFEAWMGRHPDVYTEFKKIAESLLNRNRTRYGAKAIMEVLRYHRVMSGQDESEPFKINNIYSSRIARKLMEEEWEVHDGELQGKSIQPAELGMTRVADDLARSVC